MKKEKYIKTVPSVDMQQQQTTIFFRNFPAFCQFIAFSPDTREKNKISFVYKAEKNEMKKLLRE